MNPRLPRARFDLLRTVVACLATSLLALGITVGPLATTDARALDLKGPPCPAGGTGSTCFSIGFAGGQTVALNPYAYFTQQLTMQNKGEGTTWQLRLDRTDGTFGIVNRAFGKCLEVRGSSDEAWNFVYGADCQVKPEQKWYFHPNGGGFMIRAVTSGRCLAPWEGDLRAGCPIGAAACRAVASQRWAFGWNTAPSPRDFALAYAAKKCEAAPTSCSWDMKSEAPAAPGGWVTLNKIARKVTGVWTFSAAELPWTAYDTVPVPIVHDRSGQSTVYALNTDPKPPVCRS